MATGAEFRSPTKWIKSFSLSHCHISSSLTPLSGTKMMKTNPLIAKWLLNTTAPKSGYQTTLNWYSHNSKALDRVCPRVVTAADLSDQDMWACLKKNKTKTNHKHKNKTPITTKKRPTHAKFGHRFASDQMPFGTSDPCFTSTSTEWAVKQRWLWAERQTASTDYHLEGPVKSSARKTAPLFPFLSDLWFYKAH